MQDDACSADDVHMMMFLLMYLDVFLLSKFFVWCVCKMMACSVLW